MYKFLGIICVFILIGSCNSLNVSPELEKGFIKYYGGASKETASGLIQSPDGGFVFIGSSESFTNGGSDVYIVKTDASGQVVWEKNFGGIYADSGKSIKAIQGGYVAVGSTSDSLRRYIYLLRLNEMGDTLWTRKISANNFNTWGNDVIATNDGGFAIAGAALSTIPGRIIEAFILKTNNNGTLNTLQVLRGFENSVTVGTKILEVNDGGEFKIEWLGNSLTGNPPGTFVLVRIRDDGQQEFAYQKSENFLNAPNILNATDFKKINDGSYIVTGVSINAGVPNMYFLRLGSDLRNAPSKIGEIVLFGGTTSALGSGVQQTADGGFVLVGTISTQSGGQDIYLVKLNADGSTQFVRTFGGNGADNGVAVVQTRDGGFCLLGTMSLETTPSNNPVITLIKTDASGNITN